MKNLSSKWWDDQLVKESVAKAETIADLVRIMGMSVTGSAYSSAKRHIKRLGVDVSHFKGYKARKIRHYIPDDQVFTQESSVDRQTVKKRLLQKNLIEYKCTGCGNAGVWKDRPLTLQLEHKNGKNTDNRLENLEFLCPNCHTQTSTWGTKNIERISNNKRSRCDYFEQVKADYVKSQANNIDLVLKSGIDFAKLGWSIQVSKLIKQKPQRVKRWMLRCLPEIYENQCYKRSMPS